MNQKIWTVMETLQWSARFLQEKGSDSPRVDAELLLCAVLGCKRVQLYTSFDRPMDEGERGRYRDYIRRRAGGEPVAYILGSKGFAGLDFAVSPVVLIPRPETELLVEKAFADLERVVAADPACRVRVLDAGTGSGCIAVTIAAWWRDRIASRFPDAQLHLHAWDISLDAIEVARGNSRLNDVESMIVFSRVDMLSESSYRSTEWNLIISNPPYIADVELSSLDRSVREHEPHLALRADGEGLAFYEALARFARPSMSRGGKIFLEIGSTQPVPVQNLLASYGWKDVHVELDYARLPRNVFATNPG